MHHIFKQSSQNNTIVYINHHLCHQASHISSLLHQYHQIYLFFALLFIFHYFWNEWFWFTHEGAEMNDRIREFLSSCLFQQLFLAAPNMVMAWRCLHQPTVSKKACNVCPPGMLGIPGGIEVVGWGGIEAGKRTATGEVAPAWVEFNSNSKFKFF